MIATTFIVIMYLISILLALTVIRLVQYCKTLNDRVLDLEHGGVWGSDFEAEKTNYNEFWSGR